MYTNKLVTIVAGATNGLDCLLAYLDFRWRGAMYFPIPEGEWHEWSSTGPETEYGTTLRILTDKNYSTSEVSGWLTELSKHYRLDTTVTVDDVDKYRYHH